MLKIWGPALITALCASQSATGPPASAAEREVQLTNDTRMAIVEVYAAPVGTGRWQQDLLGDDFLGPATSVSVRLDDGGGSCRFDFKTVFDDGTTLIRRDVYVCAIEGYAISKR
jgi:hypothetical protein